MFCIEKKSNTTKKMHEKDSTQGYPIFSTGEDIDISWVDEDNGECHLGACKNQMRSK